MNNIPEGFILPTHYGNYAGSNNVTGAYVGQSGGQPYRFFIKEIYNQLKSEVAGIEVKDSVEFVEFLVDAKNQYAHRIDASIFKDHPEIIADYQKWKEGKKSNLTEVREWENISHSEMGMLIAAGFYTVEQLSEANDEKAMTVGLNWKDLWNKAKQHVASKQKATASEKSDSEYYEMKKLMAEKDQQLAAMQEMIAEIKSKQDEPKKRGRKPGVQLNPPPMEIPKG